VHEADADLQGVALSHALRRGSIVSDVKLLATWDGWCDPCGTERPLVLVEIGPRGVRAFFGGVGIEDRTLHLTCRVCGQWQAVPQHEEDDELEPIEQVEAHAAVAVDPLATARTAVRTALFAPVESAPTEDETADPPARRASDIAPALSEAPAAEAAAAVEVAEVMEVTEVTEAPAAKALARWFAKKAADETADVDEADLFEDAVTVAADVLPAPKRRWFAKRTVETEVEEIEDAPAEAVEDEEPAAPKRRWFAKRTADTEVEEADETVVAEVEPTAAPAVAAAADKVPAILSVAVRPAAPSVPVRPPAPRAVAPDVEVPVRPAAGAMRPTSVGTPAQTRQIPLPRTYRSTVRAASATDTAPLALLAAGYDVVAAGAR
jgi:hypothetical protein